MTFYGNDRTHLLYGDLYADRDIVVSCQFPHKIDVSKYGVPCVNIHYGILPHFRGVAPIYHQLMSGHVAGVTLHYMDADFDTGDIIRVYSFPTFGMTADEVYAECEIRGLELLRNNIDSICNGSANRTKQVGGTYYKAGVDFNKERIIHGVFFDNDAIRRIHAVHFSGKQYPLINIGGSHFELRKVV